ncbi:MAG: folate family ECF transporter S component [Tepidanaerobacteraceae bacterium]|nr:folate family ECF transporter S component [Tepidanaerobacteraceae bacterium]
MKRFSTRELVYMSFLIALNIVLTRVASIRISIGAVEGIRIGCGGFPTIMAGIMFGPAAGGIVGAIGDVVGYYINPMGAYIPLFTISAALTGIIPSLVLQFFKRSNQPLWLLMIAIGIGQLITSIILTPYFLEIAFKIPFFVTLPARIIAQAINVPIYAILVQAIKKTNILLDYSPR